MEDTTVAEKGLLQDAIDRRIVSNEIIEGLSTWVWTESKEKIVYVPQGVDARMKLREHFLLNQSTMLPLLQTKIGNMALDEKAKKAKK